MSRIIKSNSMGYVVTGTERDNYIAELARTKEVLDRARVNGDGQSWDDANRQYNNASYALSVYDQNNPTKIMFSDPKNIYIGAGIALTLIISLIIINKN